jgi:hypothetical protein
MEMGPLPQKLFGFRVEYLAAIVALALMAPSVLAPHFVSYPVDDYCKATPGCVEIAVAKNQPTAYGEKFQQVWYMKTAPEGVHDTSHHHHHHHRSDASGSLATPEQLSIGTKVLVLADKRYNAFEQAVLRVDEPLIICIKGEDQ